MSDDENVHYLPPSEEILMESERRAELKWEEDPPETAWETAIHWTVAGAFAIVLFLTFAALVAGLARLIVWLWP